MQQQKPKRKPPERKCTGCGEKFEKSALIRVVRTPEGDIEIDRTGKRSGRGAYICRNIECFRRSRKTRRLEVNLDCRIPDAVYDAIESALTGEDGNG